MVELTTRLVTTDRVGVELTARLVATDRVEVELTTRLVATDRVGVELITRLVTTDRVVLNTPVVLRGVLDELGVVVTPEHGRGTLAGKAPATFPGEA